jgi:hypothetical protein
VYGAPPGYTREGTLGLLAMTDQPGTQPAYLCRDGIDEFDSLDAACEGKTLIGKLGAVWTAPLAGSSSLPLFRCLQANGERFLANRSGCEGLRVDRQLGYVLTGQ